MARQIVLFLTCAAFLSFTQVGAGELSAERKKAYARIIELRPGENEEWLMERRTVILPVPRPAMPTWNCSRC